MFLKVIKERWYKILLFAIGIPLLAGALFGVVLWFATPTENRSMEYLFDEYQYDRLVTVISSMFGVLLLPIGYSLNANEIRAEEETKDFATQFKVGDKFWGVYRRLLAYKIDQIPNIKYYVRRFTVKDIHPGRGVSLIDLGKPSAKLPRYTDPRKWILTFDSNEDLIHALQELKVEYQKQINEFDIVIESIAETSNE